MKKKVYLLLISLLCNNYFLKGQNDFFMDVPCYKKIVLHFYSYYDPAPEQRIGFIKKRDGWYISTLNDNGSMETYLYRKVHESFYHILNFKKRPEILTRDQILVLPECQDKLSKQFNFERCAFLGYDQWCWDVIKEYSKKTNLSDRELESLGRAYANYANGFLPYFQYDNSANSSSPFRKQMKPNEKISSTRIDSFLYYEEKTLDAYKQLVLKNPNYSTIVGNFSTKLNNEYMDIYLKCCYLGRHDKALSYLKQCSYSPGVLTTAYNYFNGLPQNAILISYGDNDTYPLWYLQLTSNFRRDVAVLNISLLGVPSFNKMITDSSAHFQTISLDTSFVKVPFNNYLLKDEKMTMNSTDSIPFEEIARNIKFSEDSIGKYKPARYYIRCADKQIVAFENKDYITLNDLVLLQVISENINKRNIFFTSQDVIPQGLAKNFREKGIHCQINCQDNPITDFDREAALSFFGNGFRPFAINAAYDMDKERTISLNYANYITLIIKTIADIYNNDSNNMSAMKELSDKTKYIWNDNKWHYNDVLFDLLKVFYKAGMSAEATEMRSFLEQNIIKKLPEYVKYEDAWYFEDYSRLNYAEYYVLDIIENTDLTNSPEEKKALDTLLEKIRNYQK